MFSRDKNGEILAIRREIRYTKRNAYVCANVWLQVGGREPPQKGMVNSMPKKVLEEDTSLYTKVLLAFSFIQLALALLLYIVTAVNAVIIGIAAAVPLVAALLFHRLGEEKKWVRVLSRVLSYIIVGGMAVISLVFIGVSLYMTIAYPADYPMEQFWMQVALFLGTSLQTALLLAVPFWAIASLKGHRFDVVTLRIFCIVEMALALITTFYLTESGILVMGIQNLYFSIFFCLTVAVTLVSSFMAFPVKSRMVNWIRRRASSTKTVRNPAEKKDTEAAEETAGSVSK